MAFDFETFGSSSPQTPTVGATPASPTSTGSSFDFNSFGGSPAPAPLSPPPDTSVLADKATFPATATDNPLDIAGKVLGNLPASTVNFGKSVFDFLNPLNAAKKVGEVADALKQNEADAKNAPSVGDVLKEVPGQAYRMLAPQFLQHLFAGDFSKAAQAIENDPVGQIAPLVLLARQGAQATGKGAQFDAVISKAAAPITKSASEVGSTAAGSVAGSTRFLAGQLTGISPDTIHRIVQDPAQFSKEAQSTITRPALAQEIASAITDRQNALHETGSEYSGVRTGTKPIPVNPDYLTNLLQQKAGLSVSRGKIVSSGASDVRAPSDISALQSKFYNVWQPEFQKGYLTPQEYLNFRSDLSRLAYNDSGIGKSTPLANFAERARGQANSDLRQHVPGLQELDAKFAPEQTALTKLTTDLVDKEGNLSDAAINKIANATGKGKDPLLARLETLSPGITGRIRLLKAVEDLQNSREVKTGTYLRAGALGAGLFTLNPYLVVSAIMSIPEIAVPLLRGVGYSADTIGRVVNTLRLKEAAVKASAAAKEGVTKSALAAPADENQPPTQL